MQRDVLVRAAGSCLSEGISRFGKILQDISALTPLVECICNCQHYTNQRNERQVGHGNNIATNSLQANIRHVSLFVFVSSCVSPDCDGGCALRRLLHAALRMFLLRFAIILDYWILESRRSPEREFALVSTQFEWRRSPLG